MRALLALLAAMLVVVATAGVVQGALRVIAPVRPSTPTAQQMPSSSQLVPPPLVAATLASPAAGTTGTIELPPLPAAASDDLGTAAIAPAGGFSTARATGIDRGRALECLTAAVYYEAASEPDDGERAVAQVVLNRVRHPAFPNTVCGVVYQGSEHSGCQFSFACDGAYARAPSRSGWARATRIAAAALGGYVFAPVGLATHYHTYAVTPAWNRTLVMTDAIGAHFFHRWKGYWGTPRAFAQHYFGNEPVPGPHRPIEAAAVASPFPIAMPTMVAPTTPTARTRAITPPAQIRAEHAKSGEVTSIAVQSGDPLLPASQVLDRWKDSGKPLR